mmetsp:Transcript_15090/g.32793  ORF Transcript_15090/g.32793 Transcript_15090/m.32793 type:complete len:219 (-) Transcript_15090:562-1218(-)
MRFSRAALCIAMPKQAGVADGARRIVVHVQAPLPHHASARHDVPVAAQGGAAAVAVPGQRPAGLGDQTIRPSRFARPRGVGVEEQRVAAESGLGVRAEALGHHRGAHVHVRRPTPRDGTRQNEAREHVLPRQLHALVRVVCRRGRNHRVRRHIGVGCELRDHGGGDEVHWALGKVHGIHKALVVHPVPALRLPATVFVREALGSMRGQTPPKGLHHPP